MRFQLIKVAAAVAWMIPLLGISAHEAKATTVTVSSVTGLWSNVTEQNSGQSNFAITAGDPTTLSWGDPATTPVGAVTCSMALRRPLKGLLLLAAPLPWVRSPITTNLSLLERPSPEHG